jgi:hypothetical protein
VLRAIIHRVSLAGSRDAVALEQPQPVLELCDAERKVLDLFASREPRARKRSLHGFVASRTEAFQLGSPGTHGVTHGAPHRVALDTDAAREIVRHLVGGLDAEARPADTGEEKVGDRPGVVARLAHRAPF